MLRMKRDFGSHNLHIAIDNIASVDIIEHMAQKSTQPEAFLPLPAATFHILMAVAEEDRHGYAIIQDVEARTGGELRLSAGTLYRSIQRMLEQGLVLETQERPAPELDDERRRYYRISPLGAAVARAEATRMSKLVKWARAIGFAPGKA
jgi:DNA-binding PadR family transcriptional regulator